MKKIIALFLALIMVLSLVACGNTAANDSAADAGDAGKPATDNKDAAQDSGDEDEFMIGYNNNGDGDSFSKTLHDGSEAAAAAKGIPFLYAESAFQPDKIAANCRTLILQGADVIVDFNVTPDAYTNLIPEFKEQGVPVLMVDTYTEGAYFFGANNSVAGSTAGNYMADYATENWGGEIDLVITLGTWTQGQVVMDRCDGIIKGVTEKMPDFDVDNCYQPLEVGTASSDQLSTIRAKLTDLFTMYPDADNICIGLYTEQFAPAVFTAVEQAGRTDDVILVTLGCEDTFKEDVKTDAHPYWVSAVAFFPERYGEYIVNICEQFKNGEEVPTMNYMDHIAVSREEVKDLYPEYFQ